MHGERPRILDSVVESRNEREVQVEVQKGANKEETALPMSEKVECEYRVVQTIHRLAGRLRHQRDLSGIRTKTGFLTVDFSI
jgi:hypothetical protein